MKEEIRGRDRERRRRTSFCSLDRFGGTVCFSEVGFVMDLLEHRELGVLPQQLRMLHRHEVLHRDVDEACEVLAVLCVTAPDERFRAADARSFFSHFPIEDFERSDVRTAKADLRDQILVGKRSTRSTNSIQLS